ncbi:IclR family transcriptional regulator [Kordiimonas pumila]|uniref:IclR family transcriptional regulator n=1 Tax=Kordiimonas pumila TaxID=2161677 RepID=A0ABV7D4A9_9PROT|nr:IclR family transcriptional regulator [Kordiimonas pumila]
MSRQGIQSVEIGLRILEAVSSAGKPVPLKEIALAAGLPASQTHKYLASLISGGMVRQNDMSGQYDLGPAAVRVGLSAIARQDAIEIAADCLRGAVKDTGRMGLLSVMGPHGATVIRIFMGDPAFVTNLTLGTVLPLTHSATGYIFLSFMQPSQIQGLLDDELAKDKAKENFDGKSVVAEVVKNGFACVDNVLIPGLRAHAVPIFNLQREVTAVATLVASESFSRKNDETSLAVLRNYCTQASARLGGAA